MAKDSDDSVLKERRRDHQERLRYAVRKAHDRLFSILRPHESASPGTQNPDRADLDQQLGQKKRVDADER